MKTAIIILLCLGLTVLLVGLNVSLYQNRAHAPRPREFSLKEVTNTVKRVVRYQPSVQTRAAGKFSWGMIEAPDYAEYMENLRAIGCPEKTIQDIIVADIEKTFDGRREQLQAETQKSFWRTGPQLEAANATFERQWLELNREKRAQILSLTGLDVDGESLKLWQNTDFAAFLLGFLGEAKPERIVALYLRNRELTEYQRTVTGGIFVSADIAEQDRISRAIRAEAFQILGPAELYELQLRLAIQDHEDELVSVEMTAEERRQFARIVVGAKDPIPSVFNLDEVLTEEQRQAADKKASQEIRDLLGPARFADYERAQDQRFQEVFSLTEQNQMPKSIAIKLFEIRQAAETQADQARNDPNLSPEQKKELLDSLRTETEKALIQYLGSRVYEENQVGARWLEPMRVRSMSALAPTN